MHEVTDGGWTLHYLIGRVLAAQVSPGDPIVMPGGRGDLIVLGGRAPHRANDSGSVIVRGSPAEDADSAEVHPRTLGMVWISAASGWSYLPA
ncbi:hypothetical protein [Novosphingobium album (ex Liu et al. 2023)]|uniref:Pirin C-terminal domain-containing protein n=1 Tax=Novosphingobium album (ex Liu et al. 2023) TaxID=3031130 RepID=A0ABT5WSD1_9SPHN|nr:hypothetical protein [Novosphingobium album (ex Liu et al. 2023)]MDE8652152.1 hypothetical protein [Novosphingobium album (ex Liu et al. 2023)]